MKKPLLKFRIPTAAGLVLLFLSIWITSYLIQSGVITIGRASVDIEPQHVIVSNITDTSFTVSFTTNDKALSAISVSSQSMEPTTYFDNRSKTDQETFSSHYITVKKLSPRTTYQFSILSDGNTYLQNGQKYSVSTGPKLVNTPKSGKKISGRVIMPDGSAAVDTIVIVSIQKAQQLSALTTSSGTFSVPLTLLRTSNLNGYFTPPSNSPVTIQFMTQDLLTTTKTKLSAASKLPTATLSYQYDFTGETTTTATSSSLLKIPASNITPGTVSISVPRNQQSFIDVRPQLSGSGVAGKNVAIDIEPGSRKASVQVESNGVWTYRPSSDLQPGAYTLRITTPDSFGISKTLSVAFSIFGTGSQIAGSGPTFTPTPRPTSTPTPIPTAIPSPTPTSIPNATPTTITLLTPTPTSTLPTSAITTPSPTLSQISPTPTLIALAPSATPLPTVAPTTSAQVTPVTTPAATGNLSTIVLGFVSVVFIIGGATLLFIL